MLDARNPYRIPTNPYESLRAGARRGKHLEEREQSEVVLGVVGQAQSIGDGLERRFASPRTMTPLVLTNLLDKYELGLNE